MHTHECVSVCCVCKSSRHYYDDCDAMLVSFGWSHSSTWRKKKNKRNPIINHHNNLNRIESGRRRRHHDDDGDGEEGEEVAGNYAQKLFSFCFHVLILYNVTTSIIARCKSTWRARRSRRVRHINTIHHPNVNWKCKKDLPSNNCRRYYVLYAIWW